MKNKKNMNKIAAALLTAAMTASLLIGCGSSSGSSSASSSASTDGAATEATDAAAEETVESTSTGGGDVVQGVTSFTTFFNPYFQGTMIGYAWPCYEPLAYLHSDTQEYEACLAESWEVDADECSLTIHIRQGVTFSDGTTMDADDVYFSLNSRLVYGTQSNIGNPREVEKVDDYTVKVYWDSFSLNYELWVLPQYVYSVDAYEEHGGEDGGVDWLCNNMLGTGPYVMAEFIPDVSLRFEKNDNYWGGETPDVNSYTWNVYSDNTTMLAAFLNGEIDAISSSDPTVMAQLEAAGYVGDIGPSVTTTQVYAIPLTLDESDPLYNQEVRQAIYLYGVDWDNLAVTAVGDKGYHVSAIGMPTSPFYDESLEQASYDPEKAKEMLAEAGYPDGFSTTIYSMAMVSAQTACLQAALKELGIEADVVETDFSTIQSEYLSGNTKNGIVFFIQVVYSDQQTDRYVKHFNPYNATASGTATWSDEICELWNTFAASATIEEQEANLLAYTNQYINVDSIMWPVSNADTYYYYQDWFHQDYMANCVSCGYDPFEITADVH